jgi:hypothetical protein
MWLAYAETWCLLNPLTLPGLRVLPHPAPGVSPRRGCLLKLQRHLHELLMDQLPVLRQLARVLDEMALGINNAAAAAGGAGSRLILEQVCVESDWVAVLDRSRQIGACRTT